MTDGSFRRYAAVFFVFFVISGFASMIDQTIWMREAMACFGVTTSTISIVISVFMLGLALGARLAGSVCAPRSTSPRKLLVAYALVEATIGLGALLEPMLLRFGGQLLMAPAFPWSSTAYTVMSGAWITLTMLPWTVVMGATFPIGIACLRILRPDDRRHFSYLYLANVIGACFGPLISAFLMIELLGIRSTLAVSSLLNICVSVFALLCLWKRMPVHAQLYPNDGDAPAAPASMPLSTMLMIFTVGFSGMAMEVIWIRLFTIFIGTHVYAFAAILAVYLGSTYLGSLACRRAGDTPLISDSMAWVLCAVAAVVPLLSGDPRIEVGFEVSGAFRPLCLAGIVPVCFLMGYITPRMIDTYAQAQPAKVGYAYSINLIGCIAGPLIVTFLMIPAMGERISTMVIAVALLAAAMPLVLGHRNRSMALVAAACIVVVTFSTRTIYDSYMDAHPEARIVRDHAATTVALGQGLRKRLLVNGIGMTELTPITKMMVHYPSSLRRDPPRKILVICFGMGTSARSALSWGAEVTTVELIPGVYDVFDFYHADAARVKSLLGDRMLVDDGRRFLERTRDLFDLIVIDPPPPVNSAAASLLYSREFLETVRSRLSEGGILAHWLPTNPDYFVEAAVTKTLMEVFPDLRVHRSVGGYGFHFFASLTPFDDLPDTQLIARMPAAAVDDCMEWPLRESVAAFFEELSVRRIDPFDILSATPGASIISDDRPLNEYFLLRWAKLIDRVERSGYDINPWTGITYRYVEPRHAAEEQERRNPERNTSVFPR